ncbi:Rho GTPase, putative [Entamoeba invadens IP1]|uniref:small monomeric GTPase n=1 Tax=Entamoeba invadens IP1 TaxID=370355 RepID=A0A0A1UD91_ENTIV|nr:Rho GTPase, putative [Entamoeba invadens IP1]ELP90288.1 Rho GTPase, putative [Entamoeba invadens IP1]|eukprot:XP_004257059.1 Rho GTPase, putative [Entamoeba invadens IP1]
MTAINIKVVCVGDGNVGKTCMLMVYTSNEFPTEYVPTVFDNFVANIVVDKKKINLGLWDTAGQEEYTSLRPLSYPQTDIFVLCFSVIYKSSYTNVRDKWCKEVIHHCPTAKYMVVGTKSDLREDQKTLAELESAGEKPYTYEEGEDLAKDINALCYMECSALKNTGLDDIFQQAVRFTLEIREALNDSKAKGTNKKKCVLL